MPRLLIAHPIAPGRGDEHLAWCAEVRGRRDELAASRLRVGITRQIAWSHPPSEVAVVRIDADDPAAALDDLRSSTEPFDVWYAERELEVHGAPLLPEGAARPEVVADYRDGEVDDLDMFLAVAVLLRPGQTDSYRAAVERSVASGEGQQRLEVWDMRQLTIWLQPTDRGDYVTYEAAGDLAEMTRSLVESDEPLVAAQREAIRTWFGIDLRTENWPIPLSALSWSAG